MFILCLPKCDDEKKHHATETECIPYSAEYSLLAMKIYLVSNKIRRKTIVIDVKHEVRHGIGHVIF